MQGSTYRMLDTVNALYVMHKHVVLYNMFCFNLNYNRESYSCVYVMYCTYEHVCALSVCLYVCMSVCSVCLYVCMSVCPSDRLSVRPYVCMSVCLHVCMYACLHVCMSVCPSVRPSVCMSVGPSVRPSVRPSVCLSVCFLFVCSSTPYTNYLLVSLPLSI